MHFKLYTKLREEVDHTSLPPSFLPFSHRNCALSPGLVPLELPEALELDWSPPFAITLEAEAKELASIPKKAFSFAFAYPALSDFIMPDGRGSLTYP